MWHSKVIIVVLGSHPNSTREVVIGYVDTGELQRLLQMVLRRREICGEGG